METGPKEAFLPLRTFIQETLRRSRTSYSTLQVALYYLIVIRPHLPCRNSDLTKLSPEEKQLVQAKLCGRRMFLAALILASKYLQDRNYSARAWSKISGLNTQEINLNEMAFLKAIDWKLHISEVVFQKWTDLVLKYTSAPTPPPDSARAAMGRANMDEEGRKREWCDLVMRISPDLGEAEVAPKPKLAELAPLPPPPPPQQLPPPPPFTTQAVRRPSGPAVAGAWLASPKAQEAAWALNLLRDAGSPASCVGRKRSCPTMAAAASTGVTPKFGALGRFDSPVLGASCASPAERTKRARCTWERADGIVGVVR